ncbi:hypothetical protein, partial [Anoxybacillus sp. J5B_2022]|uniref:hypothetical protein n=1 Tax=Anoxybacillus sp. J5B_2022 TaxID=3003246 RepID=UPI002285D59B
MRKRRPKAAFLLLVALCHFFVFLPFIIRYIALYIKGVAGSCEQFVLYHMIAGKHDGIKLYNRNFWGTISENFSLYLVNLESTENCRVLLPPLPSRHFKSDIDYNVMQLY